ncbi:MAG: hypothetical protein F8N36_13980 [Desulfovibrio sp.]|nr:hypothetical protein [Desulfovibrio sp.]
MQRPKYAANIGQVALNTSVMAPADCQIAETAQLPKAAQLAPATSVAAKYQPGKRGLGYTLYTTRDGGYAAAGTGDLST